MSIVFLILGIFLFQYAEREVMMKLDMIGIGERIKKRRKELGLSQIDIYEKCDITSGALSKIENGKTIPSIISFYKLSVVLECDMNWLATGISSCTQSETLCNQEEHLLSGFRELPLDEQMELLQILDMKLCKIHKARSNSAPSYQSTDLKKGNAAG